MKLHIKQGATSQRAFIFIQDGSQTDGRGLTGLAYNSSGLTWYYARDDDGNAGGTSVTPATATKGTFTSGGFVEKDATNMPGVYEIGIPNACLASGSKTCVMLLKGVTNMVATPVEIQLVPWDPQDSTLGIFDLSNGIETGYTFKQIMRLMSAVLLGKVSGLSSGSPVFRDVGDAANRVSATTDADGNRSAVTLNP